ncbi:fatty acyl-AMP ligase [Streptacidiphilus sp. PB12-B1b]|uniref:AMP-binding protein n=1 Tax=Streptacidiphilus sp. PB12-B1b TaxID=2705012 RepID=UPI0015F99260|nr:AMP-binding protein [Streptacidiphilus sp. PB12-B1b]QMU75743.1 fatty acyl-AMP ligase [Streptacidiphilus sp. PB12-B1b]
MSTPVSAPIAIRRPASVPAPLVATLPQAIAAQAHRDDAAVTFGTSARRERRGFPQFAEEIAAAAAGFAEQGVRPGERVMLRATGSHDGVLALLGLMHAGAVPVSVKPKVPGAIAAQYFATVAEQQSIRFAFRMSGTGLRDLDLKLSANASAHEGSWASDPEQTAFVQYTSGSTGFPRPIPLSHRAVLANVRAIADVAGMEPGHTGMVALPLHHDMGLVGMLSTLVQGISLVIEEPGTFLRRPMAALRLVRAYEGVHSAFPDFMLRYLAARIAETGEQPDPELLAGWRTVFCGAEPIRRASVRTFLAEAEPWGFDPTALVFCYGLAEASLMATGHRYQSDAASFREEGRTAVACLGEPIPGLDLALVDADGKPCLEGELGTVRLRGATMFSGHDGVTDHRREWFDTGDLGVLHAGRLYLNGRRGDRMTINGANLFVTDIEQQVTAEPGVEECVVLPHGESFTALVVPARNAGVDTARIAERITADFGVAPLSVLETRHSDIVRTASGKPARTHMTAELEKGVRV